MFAAAAALFIWRAAPGVTFEDSGLLAAAAATGGVAHPPGYPLFAVLGRAWIAVLSPWVADPARAIDLQRFAPPENPWTKDEIWVANRMVRM